MPMPRSSASRGLPRCSRSPRQCTSPPSGWTMPARIFSSVDLPAPFSPIRPWASPSATANDTPRSARTAPNDLRTSLNLRPWEDEVTRERILLYNARMLTLTRCAAVLAGTLLLGSSVTKTTTKSVFQGSPVELATLKNARGIELQAINFGAIITSLKVPDRTGALADVVLGFDAPDRYWGEPPPPYFGSIVGRYGNRIANARFA